ncbi:uncharacterized protein [Eleutherodactylus coqui]|uniref:uncharacterized protein n=1 Tax=Eleutherodactylus coqui TaxID=57060 RepID=UPI003462EE2D
MTECENIVDTNIDNHNGDNGRVFVSQSTERIGIVNVTMVNLQHWDTGLYKWRIWTGTEYSIIENVLLKVIVGLPSKFLVVNFKAYDTVEMNCESTEKQKSSKAWYKILGPEKVQWVAHSDGNRNIDYSSRTTVFVNEQKRVLIMKMTNLELWDSGFYQCRESADETILKEILLLVNLDTKHVSPVDVKANFSSGQNSSSTADWKTKHHRAWNILRWILFFCMGLCVLLFSHYEKISGSISYIHLMCNRSLNKT